jgi:hypothetical protein
MPTPYQRGVSDYPSRRGYYKPGTADDKAYNVGWRAAQIVANSTYGRFRPRRGYAADDMAWLALIPGLVDVPTQCCIIMKTVTLEALGD